MATAGYVSEQRITKLCASIITKAILGKAANHPAVLDVCACSSGADTQDILKSTKLMTGGVHLSRAEDPGYGRGVPFWAFYFSG